MLHPFVLKWEQPLLHDPLTRLPLALRLPATAVTILLGMAASCAAAWVSFHLLEAPFLRLKNLHSRPQI
jgi:peptidoglycan/LPS O-acetylase OafA/YrhL